MRQSILFYHDRSNLYLFIIWNYLKVCWNVINKIYIFIFISGIFYHHTQFAPTSKDIAEMDFCRWIPKEKCLAGEHFYLRNVPGDKGSIFIDILNCKLTFNRALYLRKTYGNYVSSVRQVGSQLKILHVLTKFFANWTCFADPEKNSVGVEWLIRHGIITNQHLSQLTQHSLSSQVSYTRMIWLIIMCCSHNKETNRFDKY